MDLPSNTQNTMDIRITNEEVLRRIGGERKLLKIIKKKKKTAYLGHIMRNPKYQLLQLIIEERLRGGEELVGRRCHGCAI